MKVTELFSNAEYQAALSDGLITSREHNRLPYHILNYTPKAQYENIWNNVTTVCRGLIVDLRDGEVVARPFEKFFNLDDDRNGSVPAPDAPIEVMDKVDGSLGIAYPDPLQPTGIAIATRGSFHSDQAFHATQRYQETHHTFHPRPGWTYLYEIVYPANRIVVDYGQDDNLYLIGIRNNITGMMLSLKHPHISIPRTTMLKFDTFNDFIMKWKPQRGIEGVVIHDLNTGKLHKVKTEEYVQLHKITFSLSEKAVWEKLQSGSFVDYAALPSPYLQTWAIEAATRLLDARQALSEEVVAARMEMVLKVGQRPESGDPAHRKDAATWIKGNYPSMAKYLFAMYDGRDVDPMIWKDIEPKGDRRPTLTQGGDGV